MKNNLNIPDKEMKGKSLKELKEKGYSKDVALIFDIQRFTLNDGPGIRTMVYFKGCPLRCPWCHNPESLEFHIEVANDKSEVYGYYATAEEIAEECLKDIDFYKKSNGGVTFTGGEAILQVEHLISISKILKKHDIHITLETSGFERIEEYKKLFPYVDLLLIDHKEVKEHYEWKLKGNYINMLNLHKEANRVNKEVWIRMPIIPGENDTTERFDDAIKISKLFKNISNIEILPYHPLGISKAKKVGKPQMVKRQRIPEEKEVEKWLNYFKENGCSKVRRG